MKIVFDGKTIDCSDEFSNKDLTGRPVVMPNGINVALSCFSQEIVDRHVFPDSLRGVKFYRCNLDNVFLPNDCQAFECSQRRFKVQNDGNDWEIDAQGNPTKPVGHEMFTKFAVPIPKPQDIPAQVVKERIDLTAAIDAKKA